MREIIIKVPDVVFKYIEKRIKLGMNTEIDMIIWKGELLSDFIKDIKAEIEALDIEDVCAKEHGCHTEVLEIIDRKVNGGGL